MEAKVLDLSAICLDDRIGKVTHRRDKAVFTLEDTESTITLEATGQGLLCLEMEGYLSPDDVDDPSEARKLGVHFPTYGDMLEGKIVEKIVVGDNFVRFSLKDTPDATFYVWGKDDSELSVKFNLKTQFNLAKRYSR